MFRVTGEDREDRQYHIDLIRMVSQNDLGAAIILAAVYFEWCVRRCIMALGTSSVADLRKRLNDHRMNFDGLKTLWTAEVHKKDLPTLPSLFDSRKNKPKFLNLTLDWKNIKNAHKMRNQLVHGYSCNPKDEKGLRYVELLLAATNIIAYLAESRGHSIFRKIIRRSKKTAIVASAK